MHFDPATFIASVKTAYDVAKSISSLNTNIEINLAVSKVLETLLSVQGAALTMQTEYSKLLQEKNNLEKEVMKLENWSNTENQYELKDIAPDTFVYIYKKSGNDPKPIHYICPQCYQDKKVFILQLYYSNHTGKQYKCTNCKTIIDARNKSRYNSGEDPPSGGSWMGA